VSLGEMIKTDVPDKELADFISQLDLTITKPVNLTCKITIRYGISRSLEDAISNGPTINVSTCDVRWVIREESELYESVPELENKITGIIETDSPVPNLKLYGTFLTDGKYAMDYPSPLYEIPHGQVSRKDDFDAALKPISLFDRLSGSRFIHATLNVEEQKKIKKNLAVDSVQFNIHKIDDRELMIRPVFKKEGIEYKKYIYFESYDLANGIMPQKYEVFYEGMFYHGNYITAILKFSDNKFFPKRLLHIDRYHPSDKDDEESFQKMMNDERLVVAEFIVDSIDFDRVPDDKEFNVTVPPEVSLFVNKDSTRSISLLEGKNVIGLHNLKRLADRAELQYQLQKQKSANAITTLERSQLSSWRVICFLSGVLILGLMVYLSIRKSKKINEGD
jgi:hypothetical protein